MNVAIAIVTDAQSRVLITQRALDISHGGYWEFPGGKLETNETGYMALIRELKEEVGLDILVYRYLGEIQHQYDTRLLTLMTFQVIQFRGQPRCCESQQDLRWVPLSELGNYAFPAANEQLIKLMCNGSHACLFH